MRLPGLSPDLNQALWDVAPGTRTLKESQVSLPTGCKNPSLKQPLFPRVSH